MSDFFTAVLAVGVVLGFMILIHEFGHYAAAKLLGVRVEVFSIGFGKRLLGFRRGETDYRISAIPLGGYVKMSGENPMDERTGVGWVMQGTAAAKEGLRAGDHIVGIAGIKNPTWEQIDTREALSPGQ